MTHDRPAQNPGGVECHGCGTIFIGEEWHTFCAVCADKPKCAYCGTTEGLRLYHDTGGYAPQDYICEGCFTPTDDGPCFDDLPVAGVSDAS